MNGVITQNKIKSQLDKFNFLSYRQDFIHGCFLHILVYEHQHNKFQQSFLVGYEVANALNKRSYNIYRSLRSQGVTLDKLSQEKIKELVSCGILMKGANSITLIPFFKGCDYLSKCEIDEIDRAANILYGLSKGITL